jgi:hypothetical protein
MNPNIINNIIPKTTLIYGTLTRGLFFGAGLAFSIETENYSHIPLVFVSPIAYGGYHIYKNRKDINFYKLN